MQECCIQFIILYKFIQIRRNDSRQSSHVPPNVVWYRSARQTPSDSFEIKVTTELKNNITKL